MQIFLMHFLGIFIVFFFFLISATGDIIALQDLEHIPSDIIRANLNFYAIEEELKIWGSGRLPFSSKYKKNWRTNQATDWLTFAVLL